MHIEFLQDDPRIFLTFLQETSTKKILTPCEKSSFEDSLKEILQIYINSPPDWLTTLIFHRAEDRSLHCRQHFG